MSEETAKTNHRYIFFGIIVAIILGVFIGGIFPDLAVHFTLIGDLFLNSLMMIVVPLVIFSMIVGITGLGDIRKLGSIGWRTIIYYLATTGISVSIGLFMVNLIGPGKGISPGENHPDFVYELDEKSNLTIHLISHTLTRYRYNSRYILILSDQNIQGPIEVASPNSITVQYWEERAQQDQYTIRTENNTTLSFQNVAGQLILTKTKPDTRGAGIQITLASVERLRGKEKSDVLNTLKEVIAGDRKSGKQGMVPRNIFKAMVNMDILPLILFSLLFGAAISVLGERAQTTIGLFTILNEAIMRIVNWIMLLAPVGIFGLISARIGSAGGFRGFIPELLALGKYSITVLIGLGIHAFIVLPFILYLFGRRNPIHYAAGVGAALLNAFSTASSSATLPLTMEGITEKNKISNRTASFVLPLGATINMDGTALYEAVAAIFIAQVYGVHLGPIQQMVIFLTATLAAIGAAGIPEAGLVTMVIVLKAVNLPIEGIGLILSIDWLLDRFRTTVNVWGDSVGCGVIEHLEESKIFPSGESNS